MMEQLFTHRCAAPRLRSSPLGWALDTFVERLAQLGYPPGSCRSYVVLAADFGRWMKDHDLPVETLDESAVQTYVDDRGTQRDRRRVAASHILAHLRAEGVVPPRPRPPSSAVTILVERYAAYMQKERGAADGTVQGYGAVVREFIVQRFGTGEIDLAALTASDLGRYLVNRAAAVSPKRVAFLATARTLIPDRNLRCLRWTKTPSSHRTREV